jgi:hypothetical protein
MPNKFADQFEPFMVFGFNPKREFPGTLIRLPLKVTPRELLSEGVREGGREGVAGNVERAAPGSTGSCGSSGSGEVEGGVGEGVGGKSGGSAGMEGRAGSIFDARMAAEDLENMLACCGKVLGPDCLVFLENVECVEVHPTPYTLHTAHCALNRGVAGECRVR